MTEDRRLTKPSGGEARLSGTGAPADDPAAKSQTGPPKGTLEDYKIPREEIDASAMERLEISQIQDRVKSELGAD